jgi:alpha-glucoside transport system permease protein
VSGASVTAEPPGAGAPPRPGGAEPGRLRRYTTALGFLLPAFVLLAIWVLYPTIYTIIRSFFGQNGYFGTWVGIDNYKTLFTPFSLDNIFIKAIRNNAIWVGVVPALVTAIGLIFAVLTERVRWSVAFKTAVFMPMAISLFAAGIIWRIMDQKDPNVGAVNAVVAVVKDEINPPGALPSAEPSTPGLKSSGKRLTLAKPLKPGDTAALGLTAIAPEAVPTGAKQAAMPEPLQGGIDGVVWRDFKPGGGTVGKVERGELGLPGVDVQLLDENNKAVASDTTDDNGAFAFDDVGAGTYHASIAPSTFAKPFGGVTWLGNKLITPAVMIAYIWVWAGFSMVVIAAGLSAIPRDVLEAARTDGGTEWQVFRRVTVPLLAPVLSVVFITMLINVLKVFDIIVAVAPGSSQADATVIALEFWRNLTGVPNYGVGSAIAVLLFVLVIPILALNIRRFRREV